MAIERSIYNNSEDPMMEAIEDSGMEVALEVEVIDPEVVSYDDGSVEITLIPGAPESADDAPFDANLADYLEEG